MSMLKPDEDANAEVYMNRLKAFMEQYNKVSYHCFDVCVHDFTTKKIMPAEWTCSENCLRKFFKTTQRIGQRFEETMQIMQHMKTELPDLSDS